MYSYKHKATISALYYNKELECVFSSRMNLYRYLFSCDKKGFFYIWKIPHTMSEWTGEQPAELVYFFKIIHEDPTKMSI